MNGSWIRGGGAALAIAALAGCATTKPAAPAVAAAAAGARQAKYKFFVHFSDGCPDGKDSAGPPGLEDKWHCPGGKTTAECLQVPRGEFLGFQATGNSKDFKVDFDSKSPFEDGATELSTTDGYVEGKTSTTAKPGDVFPFTVKKDPCPNPDPQIILN